MTDPQGAGAGLTQAAEAFLAAVEAYRIHSELTWKAPIQFTLDVLTTRDRLRAALRAPQSDRTSNVAASLETPTNSERALENANDVQRTVALRSAQEGKEQP